MGKSDGAIWHGVAFPKDAKGLRSTTDFGKKVWASSAGAIEDNDASVDAIFKEKDWRHKYGSHLVSVSSPGRNSYASTTITGPTPKLPPTTDLVLLSP
jgi:hypothetical protein